MNTAPLPSPIVLGEGGLSFGPLPAADGSEYSLEAFASSAALVLVFVASGCPTVRYYGDRLAELQMTDRTRGLQIVAVNANNPHLSPLDDLAEMRRRHAESPWPFPYLKDARADVARRCGAVCTPHAFAFDGARRLRYHGRIDDSRTGRRVTRHDLAEAVDDILEGRRVRVPATDPFGCSIVW